jgi:hypothetical protein
MSRCVHPFLRLRVFLFEKANIPFPGGEVKKRGSGADTAGDCRKAGVESTTFCRSSLTKARDLYTLFAPFVQSKPKKAALVLFVLVVCVLTAALLFAAEKKGAKKVWEVVYVAKLIGIPWFNVTEDGIK